MTRPIFATPDDAERAFYDALARMDVEAMMSVWAEDEELICILPGGSRFVGHATIREAWRQLFGAGVKLQVSVSGVMRNQAMLMATHSLLENVSIEGEPQIAPPMIATNIYVRGAQGWQMVLHHTSPAPDNDGLLMQDSPRIVH